MVSTAFLVHKAVPVHTDLSDDMSLKDPIAMHIS